MRTRKIAIEGNLGTEIYVEDPKLGGYTAFFADFPKIVTQGETVEEAQENLWKTTYDVLMHLLKDKEYINKKDEKN